MTLSKKEISEFLKEKWMLIALPLVYLIISFTPIIEKFAFIPDFLNLELINPQDYFGLIIGAIASIFGIVMAVVLLTVEFFKERLNKNTHTNPLENQLIRNSIYTSISLIGISFVAYLQIDSFNNSKHISLGYYIGVIFISYIYSVYPVLKTIIGKSSRIKANIDLVNTIKLSSFQNVSRQRFQNNLVIDDTLKNLKKELDSYILSNNVSAYQKINDDIVTKALSLISDGQSRNQCDTIIGGLIWLWRENSKAAIRAGDAHYFETLWGYVRDTYVYFANKKAPLLHLNDLHLFIYLDFLKLHVKLGNSMPLTVALNCIEVSFKSNLLKNCPKQEHLPELIQMYEGGEYDFEAFDNSLEWEQINDIIGLINKIQETAISLSDKDLFETCQRRLHNICSDLYSVDFGIGEYQKAYIFWQELTSSFYISSKALESGLYQTTSNCFNIPKFILRRRIELDDIFEKDARIVISSLADYLIIAFKNGKLSTDGHFSTLNDFCLIGIHLVKKYKTNRIAKNTVDYIMDVLKHLKSLAEKDIESITSKHYLAIKNKVKHFINVAANIDGFEADKKPVKKWQNLFDDFNEVSENKDFRIVKWKIKNK